MLWSKTGVWSTPTLIRQVPGCQVKEIIYRMHARQDWKTAQYSLATKSMPELRILVMQQRVWRGEI